MTSLMLQTEDESLAMEVDAPPVEPLAAALGEVLRQLAGVIKDMSDDDYTAPVNGAASGSIGNHVRHCLDHAGALVTGVDSGEIDYDHRERGTPIESDRLRAVERIHDLCSTIGRCASAPVDQPVFVKTLSAAAGPVLVAPSSVGREFAFVLSHTIHHNAMIASSATVRDLSLPRNFGYAPSTIAHRDQEACVRSPCCV